MWRESYEAVFANKAGRRVISVLEGDKSSKTEEWLLVFILRIDSEGEERTLYKEGSLGKHMLYALVQHRTGSGLGCPCY